MALPAGYSSDEDFSDDGLVFDGIDIPKKRYVHNENIDEVTKEDKFISNVIKGNIVEIKKMLEDGVDINYKSVLHGNWTALMHASSLGFVEVVKYLLEKGASTKEQHELITPLLCLCGSKNNNEDELVDCLDLLMDYGADVNVTDWYKSNALVHATKNGRQKLVLKLIDLGCKIDCADTDGWTPIFYAVDGGYLQIVQILKDAGANIKRVDNRGRTLHDIAVAKHYKEIAEIVNLDEKHVEIDDILDCELGYKRMSSYEYVLSELPSRNKGRFSGFHRDAVRWVNGIGLGSLVKLLIDKNVQLTQLLTMDEDELKELGVILSYDRKKLKYCVQKFHEHGWGRHSLKSPSEEEELDLNEIAQLFCHIIQHVHICSASTYFWRKHTNGEISVNAKAYIERGLYYIKVMQKEKESILNIIKGVEEQDNIVPSDLITGAAPKHYPLVRIVISIALTVSLLKVFKPIVGVVSSRLQLR